MKNPLEGLSDEKIMELIGFQSVEYERCGHTAPLRLTFPCCQASGEVKALGPIKVGEVVACFNCWTALVIGEGVSLRLASNEDLATLADDVREQILQNQATMKWLQGLETEVKA